MRRTISTTVLLCATSLCWLFSSNLAWSSENVPEEVDGNTIKDLDEMISRAPKSSQAYLERGYFHQRRDERNDAIADFSKAIEFDSKNGDALRRRCEMYVMTNQLDKALDDASRVVSLFPHWSTSYSQRARVESLMEKYKSALDDLNKALALEPSGAGPLEQMTQCYDELGQHLKAIETATRYIAVAEQSDAVQSYFAYRDRAFANIHAHRYDEAVKDLKEGLAIKPTFANLWAYLGLAYASQGKMREADFTAEKTMQLETFRPRGFRMCAEIYRAGGKWEKALELYTKSTSAEPTFAPGFLQKAQDEIALGKLDDAEHDLQKSFALNKYSGQTLSYLAMVESQLGKATEAQKHIKIAVCLNPELSIVFVNRARIELKAGELAKAAEDCQKALDSDSLLADAYATASDVMKAAGFEAETTRFLELAHKMGWRDPEKPLSVGTPSDKVAVKIETPALPDFRNVDLDSGNNEAAP